MLDAIGGKPELVDVEPSIDDWYANVIYIDGKKCVLLVHDGTLFASLALNVSVGMLRPIGGHVYSQIVRALESEGLPPTPWATSTTGRSPSPGLAVGASLGR
jgi:hypothetical protein